MSRMACCLLTLACELSALGETVDYLKGAKKAPSFRAGRMLMRQPSDFVTRLSSSSAPS